MPVSRMILVTALAVALHAGAAVAEKPEPTETPPLLRSELPRKTAAEILAHVDGTRMDHHSWLSLQLDRVSIDKKAGLAYTRDLAVGHRDLELSVQGPVVGHKGYGLGFEVRF